MSKPIRFFVIFIFTLNCVFCKVLANYDLTSNGDDHNTNEITTDKPFKWLKSAKDMISSPAGHVVVQVAKELINRSTGNSQVLSLNLTNLLIILLLKILIFSAGMLGANHWSGYGYGYGRTDARSIDHDEYHHFGFNKGEDYLITGFLAAQGTGFDDCLYAAACDSPDMAYEYAKAGKALLEGFEKFSGNKIYNPRYNDLITLIEKAAFDGYRGDACNITIKCNQLE